MPMRKKLKRGSAQDARRTEQQKQERGQAVTNPRLAPRRQNSSYRSVCPSARWARPCLPGLCKVTVVSPADDATRFGWGKAVNALVTTLLTTCVCKRLCLLCAKADCGDCGFTHAVRSLCSAYIPRRNERQLPGRSLPANRRRQS